MPGSLGWRLPSAAVRGLGLCLLQHRQLAGGGLLPTAAAAAAPAQEGAGRAHRPAALGGLGVGLRRPRRSGPSCRCRAALGSLLPGKEAGIAFASPAQE